MVSPGPDSFLEDSVYIFGTRKPRKKDRKRTKRLRAGLAAKNRRRVNRVAGKRMSARRHKKK